MASIQFHFETPLATRGRELAVTLGLNYIEATEKAPAWLATNARSPKGAQYILAIQENESDIVGMASELSLNELRMYPLPLYEKQPEQYAALHGACRSAYWNPEPTQREQTEYAGYQRNAEILTWIANLPPIEYSDTLSVTPENGTGIRQHAWGITYSGAEKPILATEALGNIDGEARCQFVVLVNHVSSGRTQHHVAWGGHLDTRKVCGDFATHAANIRHHPDITLEASIVANGFQPEKLLLIYAECLRNNIVPVFTDLEHRGQLKGVAYDTATHTWSQEGLLAPDFKPMSFRWKPTAQELFQFNTTPALPIEMRPLAVDCDKVSTDRAAQLLLAQQANEMERSKGDRPR